MTASTTTVTLPPQSAAPYAAAFLATYTGTERIRRLYYVDQLLHFTWENPNWTGEQLRSAANEQLVRYDTVVGQGQLGPAHAALTTGADWLQKAAGAMAPKEIGWMIDPVAALVKEAFGINDSLAAEKRTNAQSNLSDMIDRFGQGAEGQIATAYNACKTSAACLEALTKGLPEVRLGTDKPPAEMKDDLTGARVVENNRTIFNQYVTVNVDSGVSIAVDSLHEDIVKRLGDIHQQVSVGYTQVLNVLADIDKDQRDILKWINDQAKQQKAQQKIKDQQALYTGILDAARADLGAIVAMANLIDPHLGRGIQVVGGAVITIAEAMTKYAGQVANLTSIAGTFGTVIASAALAGTIVGAVVGVIAFLLSADEPDPNQVILEQLQQLQQQVAQLYNTMNARFDRIDRTLVAMYKSMSDAFNRLSIELGHIEGDLTAIQESLLQQAAQLQQIEASIGNYAVVEARQELTGDISEAIGWDSRNNFAMSPQQFLGHIGLFRVWGHVHAFDEAELGTINRNTLPARWASELSNVGMDRNLAYLDACTRQVPAGGPLFTADGVACANPLTWSLAARAAAQLTVEQPRLAHNLQQPRNIDLITTGTQIRECQMSVTIDPHGHNPRTGFFMALIDHYVATVTNCGKSLDNAVKSVIAEDQARLGYPQDASSPNPWGPADQTFGYRPGSLAQIGGAEPLAPPDDLLNHVPPQMLLASWFAGPNNDTLKITYTANWSPVTPSEPEDALNSTDFGPDSPRSGPSNVRRWRRSVAVDLTWHGTVLAHWSTMFGATLLTNGQPPTAKQTPDQAVHDQWTQGLNLRQMLSTGLVPTAAAEAALADVTKTVIQDLAAMRDRARVGAGNALPTAVEIVEGARLVLANVIAIGMPRTLDSDDVLRALLQGEPPTPGASAVDPPLPPYGNGLPGRDALVVWWTDNHQDTADPPPHFGAQLLSLVTDKAGLLRERLNQHLADLVHAPDTWPMIDDALARLGLADVIMDAAEQTGEMMPTTLPVLTKGANGPAVRRLQALLLANISGLKTDILSVDGDFGPVTDKYVKQFQSAASLVNAQGPSGEVDGITWRALLGLT